MATNTYVALDKKTVTSTVSSITFTSIPSTYTDLVIIGSVGVTAAADILMTYNGDSTSGLYSHTALGGDGSTNFSARYTGRNNIQLDFPGYAQTTVGGTNFKINVQNYANTSVFKTSLNSFDNAATGSGQGLNQMVGLWRNTSAVSSVTLTASGTTFKIGSTFSLYGIQAWSPETSTKATGGLVYSDATYWYHVFPFSGTFTPNQSITADYLVIGGGGSGGSGGGAGAYRTSLEASPLSLTAQAYTVTIGAGGVSDSVTGGTYGTVGNDTIFSTITSNGGGYGGQIGTQTSPNKNGVGNGNASGGGCGTGQNATGGSGGTYGNKGGDGSATYPYPPAYGSGGGGGAGSAGGNGTSSKGGDGGNGKNVNAAWATVTGTGVSGYYAGGGAGYAEPGYAQIAVGGLGGGGYATAPNGVVNTGSGAAALSNLNSYKGGNGGSGLVIVRYAK